jgi:superfamily I DNA/RNA helicase
LARCAASDSKTRLRLGRDYPMPPTAEPSARKLIDEVIGFIGSSRLVATNPGYGQGDWLEKVLTSAATHLAHSGSEASDWSTALDSYEGLHAIPLMTIHKSKGLEYHTVIFVGLDDGAWWSFSADQVEATAGFFVAFTRAKQRVVFTYCARRGARTKIATLYELLAQAGVKTFKIG